MGQQQLLLIVLGVIIVGIAVVVGINLFNANAEESAKDTVVSEGLNLGALAQQFYKKPVALGGGGNSFTTSNGAAAAFVVPTRLDTSAVGGLWTANPSPTQCVISFAPFTDTWEYEFAGATITVSPTTIESVIIQ